MMGCSREKRRESSIKSVKTLKNMKKITLFIMEVGVMDQRFYAPFYTSNTIIAGKLGKLASQASPTSKKRMRFP